jgi:type IV pilus assembly protein PilX
MSFSKTIQNEKGAVLITGLMLILLLTLFGLGAMQSTTLQERMAGNMQQRDLAFQAAEAGLRDAESYIGGVAILPAFNNTGGLYTPITDGTTPRWDLVDWDAATPNYFTYQAGDLGASPPYPLPKYIVEYVASVEDEDDDSEAYGASGTKSDMLRITSRGVSPNGRSVVRLQTTYLR